MRTPESGEPRAAGAFLGVASNILPYENIPKALDCLVQSGALRVEALSTFYRTAPLPLLPVADGEIEPLQAERPGRGPTAPAPKAPEAVRPPSAPDFLNGVIRIGTLLGPEELQALLKACEERLGRTAAQRGFAPRIIDLDLLLYLWPELRSAPGRRRPPSERSALRPHPDILTRPFVALPLLELAPELVLPPDETPLKEIAARFDGPGGHPETAFSETLRTRFLGARPPGTPSAPGG